MDARRFRRAHQKGRCLRAAPPDLRHRCSDMVDALVIRQARAKGLYQG